MSFLEDTKERISEPHGNIGKKISKETRKKMSKSRIGIKLSKITKDKMSKRMKGNKYCLDRKLSKEHKKKISESLEGNTRSLGYKHSESTKNKARKTVLIYKDGILIDKVLGTTVVAKKYNFYQAEISAVCLGKRKQVGGYTMKYEQNLTRTKKNTTLAK
jgi:predicted phage tail protein